MIQMQMRSIRKMMEQVTQRVVVLGGYVVFVVLVKMRCIRLNFIRNFCPNLKDRQLESICRGVQIMDVNTMVP